MYFGNVKRFYSYCITLLNITCSLQEQPCLKLNREEGKIGAFEIQIFSQTNR